MRVALILSALLRDEQRLFGQNRGPYLLHEPNAWTQVYAFGDECVGLVTDPDDGLMSFGPVRPPNQYRPYHADQGYKSDKYSRPRPNSAGKFNVSHDGVQSRVV